MERIKFKYKERNPEQDKSENRKEEKEEKNE